ncbi:MAG: HAD family hydrolase [Planctomycetota bacterium]
MNWPINGVTGDAIHAWSMDIHVRTFRAPPSRVRGDRVTRVLVDPRGILFDDTAWHRWLVIQLNRVGLAVEYESFCQRFLAGQWSEALAGRMDYWTALLSHLRDLGCSVAQISEVEVAGRPRWEQQQEQSLRLFPGVQRAWAKLVAAGVSLAILVNDLRPAQQVAAQLAAAGIRADWQPIYSSREVGAALPQRQALQAVLQREQRATDGIALLSDDAAARRSASALGMMTIGLRWVRPIAADYIIDRLADLPQVLADSAAGRATIPFSFASATGSAKAGAGKGVGGGMNASGASSSSLRRAA